MSTRSKGIGRMAEIIVVRDAEQAVAPNLDEAPVLCHRVEQGIAGKGTTRQLTAIASLQESQRAVGMRLHESLGLPKDGRLAVATANRQEKKEGKQTAREIVFHRLRSLYLTEHKRSSFRKDTNFWRIVMFSDGIILEKRNLFTYHSVYKTIVAARMSRNYDPKGIIFNSSWPPPNLARLRAAPSPIA